jgi:hypothetical protein
MDGVRSIEPTQIEAFAAGLGLPMRPWEKSAIMQLDDIAMGVWLKTKTGDKEPNMVDASDAEGVKALFSRLAASKNG